MFRTLGPKLLIFLLVLSFSGVRLKADGLREELANLRQRKIDFKKDRVYLSEDEPLNRDEKVDLKKILKKRERDQVFKDKVRAQYVRTSTKEDGLDAIQREAIEQKMQDRAEEKQDERERKFARIENRREQIVEQAHLEINGSEEYDIHIPKKENHAKARTPKAKK